MSLTMLSAVCKDDDLRGLGIFYGMGHNQRYYHESSSDLINRGIYRNLSSSIVWESHSIDATLILFDNFNLPFPGLLDYQGRFLQLTNIKNSGSPVELDHFSNYSFNDKAASILTVSSGSILRFSFRDLFYDQWITQIDAALEPNNVWRRGEPVMTWEMWPNNISYLNSSKRYLKIYQPIRIGIAAWPDYDASITYHIYLYLDANGKLCGSCARWGYWVESGIKSGQIASRLEPSVRDGADTLSTVLNEQLVDYEALKFSDLYYLPGRQLDYPSPSILTGSTYDDVTIVLEMIFN